MQKLGLDCPVSWLSSIQPLADYDYVLVEKVISNADYLHYFADSKRPKLINNRKMGTDTSRSVEDIVKVYDLLGGQVIAPDWGNEHRKSIEGYKEICQHIPKDDVIGVVQTKTPGVFYEDVKECLETYGEKVAVGFDVGSEHEDDELDKVYRRIRIVRALHDRKVHLLGMTHPGELLFYKNMPWVESINTGTPVMLGFKGISLLNYERVKDVSSYNYMDMDYPEYDEEIYDLIERNIMTLRCLI